MKKTDALGDIIRQLIDLDQVTIRRMREHLAAQADGPPELGLYEEQAESLRGELHTILGGGDDD